MTSRFEFIGALKSGAAYFAVVFVFAFILGVIRVLVVAPRVGPLVAVLLETPIVLTFSWLACERIGRRLVLGARGLMGAVAFMLLMAMEFAMSIVLFGQSARAWFGAFATAPGAIGLLAQMAFGVMPIVRRP